MPGLADLGFGVDRSMVAQVIYSYLLSQKRENPFKDGTPGKNWWQGFLRRWPSLSERKPQHFPVSRANASSPEVMDRYFKNVQVIITIQKHINLTYFFCRIFLKNISYMSYHIVNWGGGYGTVMKLAYVQQLHQEKY